MGDLEVQELAGAVALLKADILTDAHGTVHGENLDASVINKHMAKLDEWYYGLPSDIRLAALFSDQGSALSPSQRRGLLFVHILFLGAVIVLHRQILTSMAAAKLRDLPSLPKNLVTYSGRPVIAARQIAQIFRFIDYEENLPRWSWLCM